MFSYDESATPHHLLNEASDAEGLRNWLKGDNMVGAPLLQKYSRDLGRSTCIPRQTQWQPSQFMLDFNARVTNMHAAFGLLAGMAVAADQMVTLQLAENPALAEPAAQAFARLHEYSSHQAGFAAVHLELMKALQDFTAVREFSDLRQQGKDLAGMQIEERMATSSNPRFADRARLRRIQKLCDSPDELEILAQTVKLRLEGMQIQCSRVRNFVATSDKRDPREDGGMHAASHEFCLNTLIPQIDTLMEYIARDIETIRRDAPKPRTDYKLMEDGFFAIPYTSITQGGPLVHQFTPGTFVEGLFPSAPPAVTKRPSHPMDRGMWVARQIERIEGERETGQVVYLKPRK